MKKVLFLACLSLLLAKPGFSQQYEPRHTDYSIHEDFNVLFSAKKTDHYTAMTAGELTENKRREFAAATYAAVMREAEGQCRKTQTSPRIVRSQTSCKTGFGVYVCDVKSMYLCE